MSCKPCPLISVSLATFRDAPVMFRYTKSTLHTRPRYNTYYVSQGNENQPFECTIPYRKFDDKHTGSSMTNMFDRDDVRD
jgi:hypothetical protein